MSHQLGDGLQVVVMEPHLKTKPDIFCVHAKAFGQPFVGMTIGFLPEKNLLRSGWAVQLLETHVVIILHRGQRGN